MTEYCPICGDALAEGRTVCYMCEPEGKADRRSRPEQSVVMAGSLVKARAETQNAIMALILWFFFTINYDKEIQIVISTLSI